MPYWIGEQETALKSMAEEGKSVEEMAKALHRSPEAVRMKLKRLGLETPAGKKVTVGSTTTPTPQQQPIKPAEDLVDFEEALRMLLGALKRLNEPDMDSSEVRKIRLIISGLKAYGNMWTQWEDIDAVKKRLRGIELLILEDLEAKLHGSETPEEKQKWQARVDEWHQKLQLEGQAEPYRIWARRAIQRPGKMTRRPVQRTLHKV